MRDNLWLKEKLEQLHERYFPDIEDGNDIIVSFGRKNKTRLGSIALREKGREKRRLFRHRIKDLTHEKAVRVITINGYFIDEEIPEELVLGVLAHEFCHFVHGFNSLRTKEFCKPHQGGIIDCELKKRGLDKVLRFQKKWLKLNWKKVIS